MKCSKKPTCLIFGCLALWAASAPVGATTSAQLAVTGRLQVGACSLSFPEGNTLDLGELFAAKLNPNGPTLLPNREVLMTIECPSAAALALAVESSTSFTGLGDLATHLGVHGTQVFSLESQGRVVGAYTTLFDARYQFADGGQVSVLNRSDNGAWRGTTAFDVLTNHPMTQIENAWGRSTGAGYFQRITSRLIVRPVIASTAELPSHAEQLELNASMLFKLVYL